MDDALAPPARAGEAPVERAAGPGRLVTWSVLLLLALIWGTTWAAIRISLEGIPPLTGVALRFGLAAAVLLLLAPAFRVRLGRDRRERRLWLINALVTFCIPYSVLYWAEQWVPSWLAAVLFATFPLFTALFAHFALPGERLSAGVAVGVLLGFAGVAVVFSEDFGKLGGSRVALAAAVLLISPFSAAIGNVATKRWGGAVHPLSVSAVPMGITALAIGALAALTEADREATYALPSVAALFYLALFGSALTFTLYFYLLRHLKATNLSLLNYAIPVVAVVVGTLWMDEPLTARVLAGGLLVVVGVALAVRKRKPKIVRV